MGRRPPEEALRRVSRQATTGRYLLALGEAGVSAQGKLESGHQLTPLDITGQKYSTPYHYSNRWIAMDQIIKQLHTYQLSSDIETPGPSRGLLG